MGNEQNAMNVAPYDNSNVRVADDTCNFLLSVRLRTRKIALHFEFPPSVASIENATNGTTKVHSSVSRSTSNIGFEEIIR